MRSVSSGTLLFWYLPQLRHTCITNLIHAGVDPKTVRYLAGHENEGYGGKSGCRQAESRNQIGVIKKAKYLQEYLDTVSESMYN